MKKRKIYEISVINKTYSKTISDETKFYTSDTALELGFELKETEYTFKSAEIVLLNIDDRSLVTRPVAKVNNDFVYELDDDIIAHYGEWGGQLRFEQAGETYVSSPVKFRIENDLGNERPPQLSDVQSWVSLKRYADNLTEELKQAVLEVEGMDGTFNGNELTRQTTFEMAEQSRQTTFETNESERDATFNTNEDIRQTQELEREEAEATRQTAFDENEANRTETFNTNEATRQENETERQQGETQRESAESSRMSAENQRKIDHENRSAEFDGKADKVVLKNLVVNGNFSNGLNGWLGGESPQTINGDSLEVTGTDSYPFISATQANANLKADTDEKLYLCAKVKAYNPPVDLKLELRSSSLLRAQQIRDMSGNTWNQMSGVVTSTGNYIGPYIRIIATYEDNESANNSKIGVREVMAINLTQTFGVGNEPTKEEMDELIKTTGYIDEEYALNNKEILIWTLALIRRNKNAIVGLGGA